MPSKTLLVLSFGLLSATATAQTAPLSCSSPGSVPPLTRAEGFTERAGDFFLSCTGGTPTPQGQAVPLVNFTLTATTNITSRLLALNYFNEALLIVDEPNSALNPSRPILNCGAPGAADSGAFGPGVCPIVSTGNPQETYDGTPNGWFDGPDDGTANDLCGSGAPSPPANQYGCGRPNVFQGRRGTILRPSESTAITFFAVPFDPPGDGQTRTFRITNLRLEAQSVGVSPGPIPAAISATISITGQIAVAIENPQQVIAYNVRGLQDLAVSGSSPIAGGSIVTIAAKEGYATAWMVKNFSFATGDNTGIPGNATFDEQVWAYWIYNGGTNYPLDVAHNVPGAIYNTESGFQWRNTAPNGPPSPNPPSGTGTFTVLSYGGPLQSAGFGGWLTHLDRTGIADAGTRVAIQFGSVPIGVNISVPPVIQIKRSGGPEVTGVMVLTQTNRIGAGDFSPLGAPGLSAPNLAVYEVLWADPFTLEEVQIPVTVLYSGGTPPPVQAGLSFAPLLPSGATREPLPVMVPRFFLPTSPIPLFPTP